MDHFVSTFNQIMEVINGVLWHDAALYAILGIGILFTFWSGFCQYRALTHGVAITLGKYDDPDDPGAINHFQALSTALSATVGIGNIGGVATAVALGGPGAVFWMWIVGLIGMALKTTEVTLAMLYRNTDDPDNPHGGAMWVADKGFRQMGPKWAPVGKAIASLFCVTLLIATITGGNMFQAFNVAEVTSKDVPQIQYLINSWTGGSQLVNARLLTGVLLAVLAALVIIGGIKRIGQVAGALVPFMCGLYLLLACYVLFVHFNDIPTIFASIVRSAFASTEAQGAFLGGTIGSAFSYGMQRALFSNEAGQGSAPIAHSAAKTDEPVREGLVAGLEPFIDTLVVCTMTALVILASGAWNREPIASFASTPDLKSAGDGKWIPDTIELPQKTSKEAWQEGESIFVIVESTSHGERRRLTGTVHRRDQNRLAIDWDVFDSADKPRLVSADVFNNYLGAALTSHAFNRVVPGMGSWIVLLAVWLFAFSTVISWNYYGEQGILYLFGERSILPYRVFYCVCIVVACTGLIRTERELNNLTNIGTGVMLFANLPICLIFGKQTMNAYHDYLRRLKAGEVTDRRGS
ncbi:MAG: amino acid transporter [Gemmatales bacterium]|nr:MAG: amino acid transporter [Gemmatales bacterium]